MSPPEDVIYAGKSIINIMPYKKVSLPFILSLMPQQHLVQESPIFFHKKIILDNVYISDNYIEENVFHLSEKTDAVIAEYRPNTTSESFKLMLIKYPDNDTARLAFDDVLKLWRSWGKWNLRRSNSYLSRQSATLHLLFAGKKYIWYGVPFCKQG